MPVNLVVGNDGGNILQGGPAGDLIYGFNPEGPQGNVNSITATRVASGLSQPLFASAPPGDLNRLFIVEKGGAIKILDLATQQVLATPFLNLTGQIPTGGEQGLLGLTFDPNFAQNGFFYINVINTAGDTEIRRYQVSSTNPNQADAASASLVITIDQPAGLTNHKAGWLGFGPDGYLYAALGDGGGGGDPGNNAQNINSLLGKMLRLDVSADAFPADSTRNYSIPADNPFVGIAGADEIWALGLRNPWRSSFDRGLGELVIADVGQGSWEEIDIGQSGANFGWDIYEGNSSFSGTPFGGGTLTAPIHVYGRAIGQSITGGYVYRGESEGLQGDYFFADFSSGKVFTLNYNGSSWVATERTSQIAPNVGAINSPASFGEDGLGNLYIVDIDGEVFRLTPNVASADQGDQISGMGGSDMLYGGSGNDMLDGGEGNDELHGGNGNDTLNGGIGIDIMSGGAGNDTYYLDSLSDQVFENVGGGTDTVIVTVNGHLLRANVENGTVGTTTGLNLLGNGLNNVITGNSGDDILQGAQGNDSLYGLGGNDTLYGGVGNDIIDGGADNDILDGKTGNDTLIGGAGNDTFYVDSLSDQVIENSGEGTDTATVSVNGYSLTANVENGMVGTTAALTLSGNGLGNTLTGNSGNDTLRGFLGDDVIIGGGGNDTIDGGADNDILDGKTGNDMMTGGAGNDTFHVDSLSDQVFESAGGGTDTVIATVNGYSMTANVENGTVGTTAGLNLIGTSLDNVITGNAGSDFLQGAPGNDTIYGLGGSDTVYGGAGNDTIDGGAAQDILSGKAGNDTFVFRAGEANGDTMTDFAGNGASAGDQLQFSGYGTAAQGASLVQIDSTHWQINSSDGVIHDVITLSNAAPIHSSDYLFV